MRKIKKMLASTLAAVSLLTSVFAGNPVAFADDAQANSLVAHYTFDEDVKDYSGNGNNGTVVGSLTYTDGIIGKGAKFNGSSYIEVADNDTLDLSDSNYTMSAWIYKEDIRPKIEQPILNKLGSSIDDTRSAYAFSDRDNVPYVTTWDTDNNYIDVISDNKLDIQKWTLLTVTNDGNTVKYYYDGVLKSNKPGKCVTPLSNGSLQIGFNNVDQSNFFTGVMDDLRIYNRPLSPQEVKELFDQANANIASKKPALAAYYKFDGDLKDSSGNKNDGTAVGNVNFEDAILGKGANFDGTSYVEVNDSDFLDLNNAFTFSVWLYKQDISPKSEQAILTKMGSSKYEDIPSYIFADRDNLPYISSFDENNNQFAVIAGSKLDINKWTLVTASFDGKSVNFYYNGKLVSSQNVTYDMVNSSGKLTIGFSNADSSCFFKGKMDDLKIFNYALSASEIKKLYDSYPAVKKDEPSSWAVSEIEDAKKLNLTTDKVLSDYQSKITREEFCELAVKLYEAMSGKVAEPASVNPFVDTENSEILKAYNLGIVTGVTKEKFAPQSPVSRQEISSMLLRVLKAGRPDVKIDVSGVARFKDEDKIAKWALEAVRFFSKNGILKGEGDKSISIMPTGNTTKEQAVALVKRMYEKFVNNQEDNKNEDAQEPKDNNVTATTNSDNTSATGIDGLIEYFNSNGLKVEERKSEDDEVIGPPLYIGFAEVKIDDNSFKIFQYDLSDKKVVKFIDETKDMGRYPMYESGEYAVRCDGVLNGDLMITGYKGHPDEKEILKVFASYKH